MLGNIGNVRNFGENEDFENVGKSWKSGGFWKMLETLKVLEYF